jgi:hypothetical protein
MKYSEVTQDGSVSYLIDGSDWDKQIFFETLMGLGVNWDVVRYDHRDDLLVTTDDHEKIQLALDVCTGDTMVQQKLMRSKAALV